MKKFAIFFLVITVSFSIISGCIVSPVASDNVSLTDTTSPLITTTLPFTETSSPTSTTPEIPALVKTILEFYRNGKTYEILVGYDIGDAFFYATPRPTIPQKLDDARANSADLKRYGDFDKDGETEFIVSLLYCGAYCAEEIRIYEFNLAEDEYYVADKFGTNYPAVGRYEDINSDDNPELITDNYGFCFQCGSYTLLFSAITILRYEQGKLRDVTKEFPDLIEKDAEELLETSKKNADNQDAGYVILASYLYDMYRLGKMEDAKPIFDEVCSTVIEPQMPVSDFTCENYRTEVEAAINEFEKE